MKQDLAPHVRDRDARHYDQGADHKAFRPCFQREPFRVTRFLDILYHAVPHVARTRTLDANRIAMLSNIQHWKDSPMGATIITGGLARLARNRCGLERVSHDPPEGKNHWDGCTPLLPRTSFRCHTHVHQHSTSKGPDTTAVAGARSRRYSLIMPRRAIFSEASRPGWSLYPRH